MDFPSRIFLFLLLVLFISSPTVLAETASSELDFARKLYDDGLFLLAADQYREFVRKHPHSPLVAQARYMVAESFFAQEDLGQAEEAYRVFVREHPQDPLVPGAWFRLGECLRQMGRFNDAVAAYSHSRQLEPEGPWAPEALWGLAQALRDEGHLSQALEELETFTTSYPQDPRIQSAHLARGEILESLGRTSEARQAYGAAAQSASDWQDRSRAHFREAMALVQEQDRSGAIDILANLVQADTVSTYADSALAVLGNLYLAEGEYHRASQVFKTLSHRDAHSELSVQGGLRQAEALRLAGEQTAATAAFREWLAHHPDSPLVPEASLGLAVALQEGGHLDSAAVVLEHLIRKDADATWSQQAWLRLGAVQRQMGRAERALTTYRGFLNSFPQFARADSVAFLVAQVQEKDLDRPQAALKAYREFTSLYPRSRWADDAAFAVGRMQEANEEYQEALRSYQTFAQEHPLSSLYPRAQERSRYLAVFRVPEEPIGLAAMVDIQDQLASGAIDDQEVDLRLADIYLRHLKNFDRASIALERFLGKYPSSSRADQVLYQLSQCHQMKAQMLLAEGDDDGVDQHLEAAAAACRQLLRDHPNSQWADRCALRIIAELLREEQVTAVDFWQDQVDLYQSFLRTYPVSELRPHVLLKMGEALMAMAQEDSLRLARADSVLGLAAQRYPKSAWADTAAWRRIEITQRWGHEEITLEACRNFLRDFSESELRPRALFLQARIHSRRGEHRQAARLFRSVAEDFPYHGLTEETRLRLAQSLRASGDPQAAVAALETLMEMYPESPLKPQTQLLQAQYAAWDGRPEEARFVLSQLEVGGAPESLGPHWRLDLGDLHLELGSLQKALQSYRAVLEEDPGGPLASIALEKMGQASFQFGAYGEAQSYYEQALAVVTDSERIPYLESRRILCLYRQGLIDEAGKARAAFQKRHGKESNHAPELLMEEGLTYLKGEQREAASKAFEGLQGDFPDSRWARQADYQLGLIALSSGDFGGALERFGSLLERHPHSDLEDLILFKMGSAYYGLEQYPDAARQYEQAARVTANDGLKVDALFNAGICRAKMNDWKGAIAAYRELLDEFSVHQDVGTWTLRLGFAYLESGQPAKALEAFRKIDPGNDDELGAEIQFWVGECHFKMGRYETAAQEYLRVAFLYPGQGRWAATAEYNAGLCYEKLGREEEAKSIYQKLIQTRGVVDQWGQMAQERLEQLGD